MLFWQVAAQLRMADHEERNNRRAEAMGRDERMQMEWKRVPDDYHVIRSGVTFWCFMLLASQGSLSVLPLPLPTAKQLDYPQPPTNNPPLDPVYSLPLMGQSLVAISFDSLVHQRFSPGGRPARSASIPLAAAWQIFPVESGRHGQRRICSIECWGFDS